MVKYLEQFCKSWLYVLYRWDKLENPYIAFPIETGFASLQDAWYALSFVSYLHEHMFASGKEFSWLTLCETNGLPRVGFDFMIRMRRTFGKLSNGLHVVHR